MEFIKINLNPKGLKTGDCAIRSISFVTQKPYNEVYRKLAEIGIKQSRTMDDQRVISEYLNNLGFKRLDAPKKEDDIRYTINEFNEKMLDKDKTYLVSTLGHLTAIQNQKLYDTFNVSKLPVGNYYWKINGDD